MQQKVDNLANEVFEEVIEHEMALARLETFSFDQAIPKSATDSQKRSLLHRMNTLQASLKAKQALGQIPRFSHDDIISEGEANSSIELSIMDEDSNEVSGQEKDKQGEHSSRH